MDISLRWDIVQVIEGVLVIGWWSEEPSLKDEACTTSNRGADLIQEEKELQGIQDEQRH